MPPPVGMGGGPGFSMPSQQPGGMYPSMSQPSYQPLI